MELTDQLFLPDYIETNLQYTNIYFKIPTTDSVEARPSRRKIIETAYRTMLSKMQGNNYIKTISLTKTFIYYFEKAI